MKNHIAERIADALERIADALENENLGAINLNGDLMVALGPDGPTAEFKPEAQVEAEPQVLDVEDVKPGMTITFTYQGDADSYPIQRRVRVDELYGYDTLVIAGTDLDKYGYRQFREDRIMSPIILTEAPDA